MMGIAHNSYPVFNGLPKIHNPLGAFDQSFCHSVVQGPVERISVLYFKDLACGSPQILTLQKNWYMI